MDNENWEIKKNITVTDITFSFKAGESDPDRIAHQMVSLMDFFDLSNPRQKAGMEVAVAEAVINAIDYGCLELKSCEKSPDLDSHKFYFDKRKERLNDPEYASREISVRFFLDKEKFYIQVKDPGRGVPAQISKPKEILPYGRGIPLMRGLVDRLIIRRSPSVVTLIQYRREETD